MTPKKPERRFKVGDRVAVYDMGRRYTGVIEEVHTSGVLNINADNFSFIHAVHPNQCRKLKKRERRVIWVNPKFLRGLHGTSIAGKLWDSKQEKGFIRFVQSPEKKS